MPRSLPGLYYAERVFLSHSSQICKLGTPKFSRFIRHGDKIAAEIIVLDRKEPDSRAA